MYYKNLQNEDLPNEIWKDIPFLEGKYQVSNLGRVKTLINKRIDKNGKCYKMTPKIMKQYFTTTGYLMINLEHKMYKVHRLVGIAFLETNKSKPFINHKDFNTLNNCVDNLEWCSQKENVEWNIINKRNCRYTYVDKKTIINLYKKGITAKDIAEKLNVTKMVVYNIVHNSNIKRKQYKRKSKYISINKLKILFNKGLKNKDISKLYNIPPEYIARRRYQIKKGEI